jgi:hypothetical protein
VDGDPLRVLQPRRVARAVGVAEGEQPRAHHGAHHARRVDVRGAHGARLGVHEVQPRAVGRDPHRLGEEARVERAVHEALAPRARVHAQPAPVGAHGPELVHAGHRHVQGAVRERDGPTATPSAPRSRSARRRSCSPVPATVRAAPVARSTARTAWLPASATNSASAPKRALRPAEARAPARRRSRRRGRRGRARRASAARPSSVPTSTRWCPLSATAMRAPLDGRPCPGSGARPARARGRRARGRAGPRRPAHACASTSRSTSGAIAAAVNSPARSPST